MSLFNKSDCFPIAIENNQKAKDIAFDGCSYYFTVLCQNKIVKYSTQLCFEECYYTCREYSKICYDFKECCFWASAENCHN